MSRVSANGLGDRSSISGRVIPKIQNMVLDSALLNTQHYTAWIKGKVEQSREPELIFYTVEWYQVFLSNTNNYNYN